MVAQQGSYRLVRSDETSWSSHRWPRAWPDSSGVGVFRHCQSGWHPAWSRRSWSARRVVSASIACMCACMCWAVCGGGGAYLAIFEREDQRHLFAGNLLVGDFRGNPALGSVWLPCPGADVVNVRHGGRGASSALLPSPHDRRLRVQGGQEARCRLALVVRRRGWEEWSSAWMGGSLQSQSRRHHWDRMRSSGRRRWTEEYWSPGVLRVLESAAVVAGRPYRFLWIALLAHRQQPAHQARAAPRGPGQSQRPPATARRQCAVSPMHLLAPAGKTLYQPADDLRTAFSFSELLCCLCHSVSRAWPYAQLSNAVDAFLLVIPHLPNTTHSAL